MIIFMEFNNIWKRNRIKFFFKFYVTPRLPAILVQLFGKLRLTFICMRKGFYFIDIIIFIEIEEDL